jgi:GMP synthase-like glutamine amidotransferase
MTSQNPGIFRDFAESQNISFHEVDLHAGEKIPELRDYDALWVMGGSMNVWEEDKYPWLIEEKEAIRQAVNDLKMPFLGICLGHQLLAEALGGKAEKADNHEVGLFEITPTIEGQNHPLLNGFDSSEKWVNVHLVEVTEAPQGSRILASSNQCKNHIMQVSENAYSCQFHPEVCSHTFEGWMCIPGIPEALEDLLGAKGLSNFESEVEKNLKSNRKASHTLFKNWCGIVFH